MTERVFFRADDGIALSALVEGPQRSGLAGRPQQGSSAVLLLPGFWRRAESRRIRWLSQQLARRYVVYTLDFRGHGRSSGSFTFGRLEHLDVEALMRFARSRGVERVALVGLSMGAASIATTLGGGELPVGVAGAVLIAGPASNSAIRPRPWQGRRDVAWGDMLHLPRVEWRVPFTDKRVPEQRFAAFPDVPVRFLHARSDWLVDAGAAERMHDVNPLRGDFYLFETPGLHADEMLGRWRELVVRFVRPFVDASLAPVAPAGEADGDAGAMLAAGPWLDGLRGSLADPSAHSRDLGGLAPRGELRDVVAVSAGRDGAHLAARVGADLVWVRGLRDGSAHGVNLLANALAADAPGWSPALRRSLAGVFTRLAGAPAPGPGARHVVTPRGEGGFEVGPRERDP